MQKIQNTKDYKSFSDSVLSSFSLFSSKQTHMFPKEEYCVFTLYGEAGSGKTEYINILAKELLNKYEIKFKKIGKKLEVVPEVEFYIIDSFNEKEGSYGDVVEFAKTNKVFVLLVDWIKHDSDNGSRSYKIEANILDTISRELREIYLTPDLFHFSVRELFMMRNLRDKERIIDKQPHELVWKAFEKVIGEFKLKESYKELAQINPVTALVNLDDQNHIRLIEKHFIQYNDSLKKYVFSHGNISSHLYFRSKIMNIRNLDLSEDEIKIIKLYPENFISWAKQLGVNEEKIVSFLVDKIIKISAFSWINFFGLKNIHLLKFKSLNYFDTYALAENKQFQIIYSHFINEEIISVKIFPKEHIKPYDISVLVNALSLSEESEESEYSNKNLLLDAIKTDFHKKINVDNSVRRYQMINFVFFRMINIYFDYKISALEKSNLTDELFCLWDRSNKLSLYNFVSNIYNDNKYHEVFLLDSFLNTSISRSSILDGSHMYSKIDKRFRTSRNTLESGVEGSGHKYVNFWVARNFEKNLLKNTLNSKEFKKNYNAIEKGIGWGTEYKNTQKESLFYIRFIVLMFKNTIYYNPNQIKAPENMGDIDYKEIENDYLKHFSKTLNIEALIHDIKKYMNFINLNYNKKIIMFDYTNKLKQNNKRIRIAIEPRNYLDSSLQVFEKNKIYETGEMEYTSYTAKQYSDVNVDMVLGDEDPGEYVLYIESNATPNDIREFYSFDGKKISNYEKDDCWTEQTNIISDLFDLLVINDDNWKKSITDNIINKC